MVGRYVLQHFTCRRPARRPPKAKHFCCRGPACPPKATLQLQGRLLPRPASVQGACSEAGFVQALALGRVVQRWLRVGRAAGSGGSTAARVAARSWPPPLEPPAPSPPAPSPYLSYIPELCRSSCGFLMLPVHAQKGSSGDARYFFRARAVDM